LVRSLAIALGRSHGRRNLAEGLTHGRQRALTAPVSVPARLCAAVILLASGLSSPSRLVSRPLASSDVPVQVHNLTQVVAISGGQFTGYALRRDGKVWAWGFGEAGELGDGRRSNSDVPVEVHNLTQVVAISGGYYAAYALRRNGTVWAWGEGGSGQLASSDVPVEIHNLTDVVAIAGGQFTGYALRRNGTVWAWGGFGGNGQLGNNSRTNSEVPVEVHNLTDVVAISAGSYTAYALRRNGTVWAWGQGAAGQLGDGSPIVSSDVPVKVRDLTDVVAISGGYYTGYALRRNGTVWSWGQGGSGQLGNNSYANDTDVPVEVHDLTDGRAISGGDDAAYALRGNGTVWAWGQGLYDQLGNGSQATSDQPVKVRDLTDVVATSGSDYAAYALRRNGSVWAWGEGAYGQLGNAS
jgi:alpha-tubulin suppressor-like RCC1 family protein